MSYNFSGFKQKSEMAREWLMKEFSGIRTTRATPALFDSVFVEAYGVKMPIKQAANIVVEDSRTLRIIPYDSSQAKGIEKAVASASLGLSVAVDERGVRVIFPELTAERRTALIKLTKEKLEMARITLRRLRDEVWSEIQEREKQKEIREDEKFRLKNELQKLTDAENETLNEAAERKEKEILN